MTAPWEPGEVIWIDTADDNTPTGRDGFSLEIITTPRPVPGWMPEWWVTGWMLSRDGVREAFRTICVPQWCLAWRDGTWVQADLVGTVTHLPLGTPGRLWVE